MQDHRQPTEAQEPNQPPSGGVAPPQRSRGGVEPDSGISSARSTGTVPWSHNEVGLPVLQERESDNAIRFAGGVDCGELGHAVGCWLVGVSGVSHIPTLRTTLLMTNDIVSQLSLEKVHHLLGFQMYFHVLVYNRMSFWPNKSSEPAKNGRNRTFGFSPEIGRFGQKMLIRPNFRQFWPNFRPNLPVSAEKPNVRILSLPKIWPNQRF